MPNLVEIFFAYHRSIKVNLSVGTVYHIMTVVPEVEREAQKAYWAKHSEECTMEAMMLDSQAAIIDQQERPEVCVWPLRTFRACAEIVRAGCVDGCHLASRTALRLTKVLYTSAIEDPWGFTGNGHHIPTSPSENTPDSNITRSCISRRIPSK